METRASHMIVGGFVLLLLIGLVAFTVWIAKVDLDAEYNDYDVFFENSVFGLYKRSIVYYQGIPIGEVRDITLSEKDPSKVKVWVRLRSEVPVVEGSVARLEFQGLTGVAFIELNGGPAGAPLITAAGDALRPVIPSQASGFQEIFRSAPDLLNEAAAAVIQIQKLLSDENIGHVSRTLANTAEISGNLATASADLDALMTTARMTLTEVGQAARQIAALAETGEALLDEDARQLLAETTGTMANARSLIGRMDGLVEANEDTITQFISSSLPEINRMIMDLRATARNLSRLMSRLEKNPVDTLLGPGEREYNLKSRTREGGEGS